MQTANVMVALDGDTGNTAPKLDVTAAEIAVLRVIHGPAAVHDIEPAGDADWSNAEELRRLRSIYGKSEKDGRPRADCPVNGLFPGAAARVFERLDELAIPDDFYKAQKRATPNSPAAPTARRAKPKPSEGIFAPADAGDDDGVRDMP